MDYAYSDYLPRQEALLDLCKTRLSMLDAADLALDGKLMALVGLSSLSVSLVTLALSLKTPASTQWALAWPILVAFVLLAIMVLSALLAWRAEDYSVPGPESEEVEKLHAMYVVPEPATAVNNLITSYLSVTVDRRASTIRKGAALNLCLGLYLVQVVVLAVAIGLGFGLAPAG